MECSRRARLIAFIEPFYSEFWRTDRAFNHEGRAGISIAFEDLTDDALERLAERLRFEFWFTRRINRENRAIYAVRAERAARIAQLTAAEG